MIIPNFSKEDLKGRDPQRRSVLLLKVVCSSGESLPLVQVGKDEVRLTIKGQQKYFETYDHLIHYFTKELSLTPLRIPYPNLNGLSDDRTLFAHKSHHFSALKEANDQKRKDVIYDYCLHVLKTELPQNYCYFFTPTLQPHMYMTYVRLPNGFIKEHLFKHDPKTGNCAWQDNSNLPPSPWPDILYHRYSGKPMEAVTYPIWAKRQQIWNGAV